MPCHVRHCSTAVNACHYLTDPAIAGPKQRQDNVPVALWTVGAVHVRRLEHVLGHRLEAGEDRVGGEGQGDVDGDEPWECQGARRSDVIVQTDRSVQIAVVDRSNAHNV